MKLYKISQDTNYGYDTYDSAVVCAENEDEARKIKPYYPEESNYIYDTAWVGEKNIHTIKVEYLGEADKKIKKGLIIASFNAV